MNYTIREIAAKDNAAIEKIIRDCLVEFNANKGGTAWADPDLSRFSEIYNSEGNIYFVAEDETGSIIGGAGIGRLTENTCELQKMYCVKEARGKGVSHDLMKASLDYAKGYYKRCYLETLSNMKAAHKFYEKYGFKRIDKPILDTGHYTCDVFYIKEL